MPVNRRASEQRANEVAATLATVDYELYFALCDLIESSERFVARARARKVLAMAPLDGLSERAEALEAIRNGTIALNNAADKACDPNQPHSSGVATKKGT